MTKSKTTLFSKKVSPISDIEEGKKSGQYAWIYSHITGETVRLKKVSGEKTVYLVPLTETVADMDGITSYLNSYGLKPCVNAPQYLLGLMAAVSEEDLPASLERKDIVAAENEAASVFQDEHGHRGFLRAYRRDGRRLLRLVVLDGRWFAVDDWVFLAESLLSPGTESLGSSDSLPLELTINGIKYIRHD